MVVSPFPPPDPYARIQQIRARTREAGLNMRDQHTITQALLRRFTRTVPNNRWQLLKIDLRHEPVRSHFAAPKVCGVFPEFVPYASFSLENYWCRIETGFHAAFAAVDDGTVFACDDHLSAVRDMVALHFVRSPQMKRLHDETFRDGLEMQKAVWRRDPRELRRIYLEYQKQAGIHSAGDEAIEDILELRYKEAIDQAANGALIRERLVDMYEKVRTVLDRFAVEILTPAAGEFLIGEVPVVVTNAGNDGLAAARSGGARLEDDVLILPLGRNHLARLHCGRRCGYRSIPAGEVEEANVMQIRATQEYVFAHPDSALELLVARARKTQ